MVKKKSYNPFNMGGSYFGLIMGNVYYLSTYQSGEYMLPIISLVGGFLVGWAIHSFFRFFKGK